MKTYKKDIKWIIWEADRTDGNRWLKMWRKLQILNNYLLAVCLVGDCPSAVGCGNIENQKWKRDETNFSPFAISSRPTGKDLNKKKSIIKSGDKSLFQWHEEIAEPSGEMKHEEEIFHILITV